MKLYSVFSICLIAALVTGAAEPTHDTRSPSEIYADKTAAETPAGPEIFGVFRGRTPCQDLSTLLKATASDECNKIKCRLFLYQDPVSKIPTTFTWAGKIKTSGKWSITQSHGRTIYKLEWVESSLSLLKLDENILYILNADGEPLVGNSEFSYTLNRTMKPR